MRDVFLSYRYDDANKELARKAEALLESHSLSAVTGDVLGSEAVQKADAVAARVNDAFFPDEK